MNSLFRLGGCSVDHGSRCGIVGPGFVPLGMTMPGRAALRARRVLGSGVLAYGVDALDGSLIAARIPVNTELKCLSRSRSKRC